MRALVLALVLAGCGGRDATGSTDAGSPGAPGTPVGPGGGTPGSTVLTDPADLIHDGRWPGLRVKIDHVAGKGPDPEALQLVEQALAGLLAGGELTKPGGIELVLDEELPAGDPDAVHTFVELSQTLDAHRGPDVEGEFAVIHALWTDGHYEGDSGNGTVLGFAWRPNQLVMLHDNIQGACDATLAGPLGAGLGESLCEAAEGTVLLHELGHLFGLVNNGTAMAAPHEDPDHSHHDVDDGCLMYWAVEQSSVVDAIAGDVGLGGPTLKELDAACRADLRAAAP